MTHAPSIKEALEQAQRFIASVSDSSPQVQRRRDEAWNVIDRALATLQPSGERREAIRALVHSTAMSLPPSDFGSHRAIEAMTDAFLASGLVQDEAGATYLVWSNEHSAWWAPKQCGYNTHISHAGHYSRDEAMAICVGARGGRAFNKNPSEVPILLKDAESFWTETGLEERYRREFQEREEDERREEEESAIRSARDGGAET